MILIMGTVRVPAEVFETARGAMETMIVETRKEDGCIRYAFAQDVVDPGLMHVAEAWRDHEALKAHGASPHMAEWRKAMAGSGASERNLRVYETDEGTPI